VFKQGDQWVNKRNDASRASSVHATQREAIEAAREMLTNQGGGELSVHGRTGRIRSKDTSRRFVVASGTSTTRPR
jgi:hypothetical protein